MNSASKMRVISVNVGQPRKVLVNGEIVETGIYKAPVEGRVAIRRLNIDGDRQADLTVHGGWDKAAYAYPIEHYEYWQEQFPEMDLPWGMFGENLSIKGLFEDAVHIGDHFQVGTARLMVTQPRLPCYKLGIKFEREDIIKRFLVSGRTGFYFAVLEEGMVAAGDPITLLHRDEHDITIADIVRLYREDKYNVELMRRVVAVDALPEEWREYFQERLERITQIRARKPP
ncbi:MAG TPA: MOSC domain-containing protein [Ktedonobacteraceae bacterium]|nr:MOSC domain-containing protein [Ktedonobacteraceae bacterium]